MSSSVGGLIKSVLHANPVTVFSKSFCPFCKLAKDVLNNAGIKQPYVMELDHRNDSNDIQAELTKLTQVSTVPYVFVNQRYIGGGTTIEEMHKDGSLKQLLNSLNNKQI